MRAGPARDAAGDRRLELDVELRPAADPLRSVMRLSPRADLRGQHGRRASSPSRCGRGRRSTRTPSSARRRASSRRRPPGETFTSQKGRSSRGSAARRRRAEHEHEATAGDDQRRDLEPAPPDEPAAATQGGEPDGVSSSVLARSAPTGRRARSRSEAGTRRAREQRDDGTAIEQRPEERPHAVDGQAVGAERPDVAALVDLDERARRRRLTSPSPEQRERRPDREAR